MWIEAGEPGCTLSCSGHSSGRRTTLWDALDHFHLGAVAGIRDQLASNGRPRGAAPRAAARSSITSQTFELFDRLSAVIVRRADPGQSGADPADPLLAACQIVAEAHPYTDRPPVGRGDRSSRRSTTWSRSPAPRGCASGRPCCAATGGRRMSGRWWPGTARSATRWRSLRARAALRDDRAEIRHAPRRSIGRSRMELAPEAVTFYPTLAVARASASATCSPSRSATRAATCAHRRWRSRCSASCRLVTPLITQVLVNSVIPRSELDQLTFCALALAVTAIGMASVQMMEGLRHAAARGADRLEAAGRGDRSRAPAARLAVSRIHGGRFRRPLDGNRRGPPHLHRADVAQPHGRRDLLVQHLPDAVLRSEACPDRDRARARQGVADHWDERACASITRTVTSTCRARSAASCCSFSPASASCGSPTRRCALLRCGRGSSPRRSATSSPRSAPPTCSGGRGLVSDFRDDHHFRRRVRDRQQL